MKISNVDLKYCPHDNYEADDIEDPNNYSSGSLHFRNKVFKTYVQTIDQFGLFDLILIDGRARLSCALHAKDHLKKDGIIVLDDSDRAWYQGVHDMYKNWDVKQVSGRKAKQTKFLIIKRKENEG